MLQLVLGRAGSGKTEYLRTDLKTLAQDPGQKLMLIVPEQASFENERAMLRLLGARSAQRVQVISFTRLADQVFRAYGGIAGRRIDDGGRSMFMSLALEQVREQLNFYRKNADGTELVSLLLTASSEFKMCGLTPQDLERTAEEMPAGTLRQKMKELSLILAAYDALVAQSYVDPQDDLTRLDAVLEGQNYFAGYRVFLDSFQSFTVQEYQIIKHILEQAQQVTAALCCDQLDDPEHGMGLFSLVRRTGKSLIRMAKEAGISVAAPVLLESGKRFRCRALRVAEESCYRTVHKTANMEGAVTLYEAKNGYDESDYVAATIRRMVAQEGYRYRDFAVITRSPEDYRGMLDTALSRWEVPYFMDDPQPVDAEPLMRMALSAFRAVQSGFLSEELFTYAKTGLVGLKTEEISILENYVFIWRISGKRWLLEWTDHPQGFAETMTDEDRCALAEINAVRARLVRPLAHFSERIREADGEEIAEAVYRLLEEVEAARHLRALSARLSEEGKVELADRQLRLWDVMMTILDQTALVLKGHPIDPARYAELLRLVILSNNIASIPQGLDEVTVGAADRTRVNEPKVVFLIGALQGQFPLSSGGNCVFSDGERRELIARGLPLNDTMEGIAVQERFLAYSALSAASEKLFVSYPLTSAKGEAAQPSSLVDEIRAVFPMLEPLSEYLLPQDYFAGAEAPAFEQMARSWNQGTVFSETLKTYFKQRGGRIPQMEAVDRAGQKKAFAFADESVARNLFGNRMHMSATQIEKYHLCRFQYFCRFGLNVKERRAAELDALEYGSLMHYLLEQMFRRYSAEEIAEMSGKELKEKIQEYLDSYIETKLGGKENKTQRLAYLLARIADSAQVILSHVAKELCKSAFRPADFELGIGYGDVPALKIPLPDGGEVEINGKVDRVDVMQYGDVKYLRVIDYKTGHKEFKLSDVIYGINMQMLIYLAALSENGGERYGELAPAGVLYVPANKPVVSLPRGAEKGKQALEAAKKMRMNGLVVDDEHVAAGMEPPEALKLDCKVSSGDLEKVMNRIKRLIRSMAQELRSGKIEALPLEGEYDACAWCPYAAVCGREKDDPARNMEKWDRGRTIAELTRDPDTDGGDANG